MTFRVRCGDGPALEFLSRPGTFAYGRFDDGARALVGAMEVQAGDRVVDIGCGCGTNGVCAGRLSGPSGQTCFVDSNLRATVLAEHNARTNGLTAFQVVASRRVDGLPEGSFDVALANPPYFAQAAIAGLFIVRARALLRPGGRLYLVTRQPQEVASILADVFGQAEAAQKGGYTIFTTHKE
jgi:16S rRNA (guanine1207-N2)-methyltransferase